MLKKQKSKAIDKKVLKKQLKDLQKRNAFSKAKRDLNKYLPIMTLWLLRIFLTF